MSNAVTTAFNESDYRIAGSMTAFIRPGEYGPAECGCYLVVLEFDPRGPRLCLVMTHNDATCTAHLLDGFSEATA